VFWLAAGDWSWIQEHLDFRFVEPVHKLSYFGISKDVIGLWIVAGLLLLTFAPIGRALKEDPVVPRGRLVNFFEVVLIFLRDEVVYSILGKEGKKYLPVLWTFFFFVLYCNLLGLVPIIPIYLPVETEHGAHWGWLGPVTPTGRLGVTATLALTAGLWWHLLGIKEQGLVAYVKHIVPSGLPLWLIPGLFVIELIGHVVKVVALAVRLAANMFGGHLSLFVIIGMILMVTPWAAFGSVPIAVAVYFLEIIVALLQAFVFFFLVTLFLGMALHPH